MYSFDHVQVADSAVVVVGDSDVSIQITDIVAFRKQINDAVVTIRTAELAVQKTRLSQLQDLLARTQVEITNTEATIASYADVDVPVEAPVAVEAPADAEQAPVEAEVAG